MEDEKSLFFIGAIIGLMLGSVATFIYSEGILGMLFVYFIALLIILFKLRKTEVIDYGYD